MSRCLPYVREANPSAIEEDRRVTDARLPAARDGASKPEQSRVFQKELTLFRKEETEPREIDTLLIGLDLGEVGIDGEISGEVLGQAVLHVQSDVTAHVVDDWLRGQQIAGQARRRVRFDFEVLGARWDFEADERRGVRDLHPRPVEAERSRNSRQKSFFIPPTAAAFNVKTPNLSLSGTIAERLERDREFDGPAAFKTGNADVPHHIPIAVELPFVGDLRVDSSADWRHHEIRRISPVVKSVEKDPNIIVLIQIVVVATHFVGNDPFRVAFPAADRHVEVVVIEQDPDIGLFVRRRAFLRLHLDETRHRRDGHVDLLIEMTVNPKRRCELDSADRGPARLVARNDLRGNRRRGPVDSERNVHSCLGRGRRWRWFG